MTGHGAIIVIPEVLLQGHGVMGDVQDRVQVVGQHLGQSNKFLFCILIRSWPKDYESILSAFSPLPCLG